MPGLKLIHVCKRAPIIEQFAHGIIKNKDEQLELYKAATPLVVTYNNLQHFFQMPYISWNPIQ